jgi:hypothetical protein
MRKRYASAGFLALLFALACGTESSEQKGDTVSQDSLTGLGPEADTLANLELSASISAVPPELLGIWRFERILIGGIELGQESADGESTLEFTPDGRMINRTPKLDPQEHSFAYENGLLRSPGQASDQRIEKLTPDTLILSYEVDQTLTYNVYSRIRK